MSLNSDRLQQLLAFLAEEPNDPFTLYALATEYAATQPQEARFYYEKLLTEHPDYVGTYYHAAALYAALGEKERAVATYQKGLEATRRLGQTKHYQELQRAFRAFEDEED